MNKLNLSHRLTRLETNLLGAKRLRLEDWSIPQPYTCSEGDVDTELIAKSSEIMFYYICGVCSRSYPVARKVDCRGVL
jgi:hypothetical protein